MLKFDVRDVEILYAFPKGPSKLEAILRLFAFTHRAAPPTYDEISGCLLKSLRAGVIQRDKAQFVVNEEWYEQMHAADATAENEIESMLQFEDSFVGRLFPAVNEVASVLSEDEYKLILARSQI